MPSLTTLASALLLSLNLAPALAQYTTLPNVKVIPLDNAGCYNWPGYIQSRPGFTGSIQFLIDQAEDEWVNGLNAVSKGFNYSSGWSDEHLVMELTRSRRFAKEIYQCYDGRVAPLYGNRGKLSISKDNRNAFVTFREGYPLQVYAHEVDGVRQPGVFLGAQNQTTWGFYYERSDKCGENGYYQPFLQGLPVDPETEPKAAYDPEFRGFLKVVQYS